MERVCDLDKLDHVCRRISEHYHLHLKAEEIPIEDEAVFELLRNEGFEGLLLKRVKSFDRFFQHQRVPPLCFSDIVAASALTRIGALESGLADDFTNRVAGVNPIEYYDDRLRTLLEGTCGMVIYKEQLAQVLAVVSGFDEIEANRLSKAACSRDLETMNGLKDSWFKGALENDYSVDVAESLWGYAEMFGRFLSSKSHAAGQAALIMKMAFLKAHYPYDYVAGCLDAE